MVDPMPLKPATLLSVSRAVIDSIRIPVIVSEPRPRTP